MRKLTVFAIALGMFIAGGLLGYAVAREFFRTSNLVYEMASIDHMNTYVMIQRWALLKPMKPRFMIFLYLLTNASMPRQAFSQDR